MNSAIESVQFGLLSLNTIALRLFTANISISFRRNDAYGHGCPWVECSMSQLGLTVGLVLKFLLRYRLARRISSCAFFRALSSVTSFIWIEMLNEETTDLVTNLKNKNDGLTECGKMNLIEFNTYKYDPAVLLLSDRNNRRAGSSASLGHLQRRARKIRESLWKERLWSCVKCNSRARWYRGALPWDRDPYYAGRGYSFSARISYTPRSHPRVVEHAQARACCEAGGSEFTSASGILRRVCAHRYYPLPRRFYFSSLLRDGNVKVESIPK